MIFVGTFDMFPCVGAPMIGSQPHFYGADPSLVANFASGINPVKEDHAIYLHFEMVKMSHLLNFSFDYNNDVCFRTDHWISSFWC